MGRIEKGLLTGALCTWLLLGLAHTAVVLAGPNGLSPDRGAPGADAVIGHPDDTDARLVGGPRALVEASAAEPGRTLLLVLPETTDSTSLLYARYQLAHALYPRRVQVARMTAAHDPFAGAARAGDVLVVAGAGVETPAGCRARASAHDHVLVECAR